MNDHDEILTTGFLVASTNVTENPEQTKHCSKTFLYNYSKDPELTKIETKYKRSWYSCISIDNMQHCSAIYKLITSKTELECVYFWNMLSVSNVIHATWFKISISNQQSKHIIKKQFEGHDWNSIESKNLVSKSHPHIVTLTGTISPINNSSNDPKAAHWIWRQSQISTVPHLTTGCAAGFQGWDQWSKRSLSCCCSTWSAPRFCIPVKGRLGWVDPDNCMQISCSRELRSDASVCHGIWTQDIQITNPVRYH